MHIIFFSIIFIITLQYIDCNVIIKIMDKHRHLFENVYVCLPGIILFLRTKGQFLDIHIQLWTKIMVYHS